MDWSRLWSKFSSSRVVVYADFIDPLSYIGFHNLIRASRARPVTVEWRGFEFNPDTPEEGYWLVPQLHSERGASMWSSVKQLAEQSEIRLNEPKAVYKTRRAQTLAHELPKNASTNGFLLKIFAAYLEDGLNIHQTAVLQKVADAFPSIASAVRRLLNASSESHFEVFRTEAKSAGFPGLPGFVYRGRNYFGALSVQAWSTIFDSQQAPKELLCSTR